MILGTTFTGVIACADGAADRTTSGEVNSLCAESGQFV
jgi:hypothetical protein